MNTVHYELPVNNNPPQMVTVINQPLYQQPMGPRSTTMTCPSCHSKIATSVVHRSTIKTHILAWFFCYIPYCMNSCKEANHSCPSCRTYLGKYT